MSGGISVTADDNWSKCVLLLNMELSGDSTTATVDSSASAHTMTFAGTATLQSTIKKFGSAGLYIPNSASAYLQSGASSDFVLGGDKFTIRFWVYKSSYTYGARVLSANAGAVAWNSSGVNWLFTTLATSTITFQFYNGSGESELSATLETGGWHHVEVDYDGSTVYLFIDGVLGSWKTATISASTSTAYLRVGGLYGESTYAFYGYFDDVQIYKGVCLHTAAFSVPTRQASQYSVVFSGTALTADGAAADYVALWEWPSGTTRTLTTPASDGTWSITTSTLGDYGLTYIADGYKPATHGPYSVSAS